MAEAILGSGITFSGCTEKIATVRRSFASQQQHYQRRQLAEGFELAFTLLEPLEQDTKNIKNMLMLFEEQVLILFQNPSKSFVCQGFIAGMLFCRDSVQAGFEGLMSSLEYAFACVQEAMRHLHHFTQQQLQEMQQQHGAL